MVHHLPVVEEFVDDEPHVVILIPMGILGMIYSQVPQDGSRLANELLSSVISRYDESRYSFSWQVWNPLVFTLEQSNLLVDKVDIFRQ